MQGAILVLSGPSGAGKSTIISNATNSIGAYYFSISTTTRSPRNGEKNGREYHFVSKEEFETGIQEGDFLEYAKVHDNYYGTSLKPVQKALNEGKLVIFDIDVQGHRLIRQKLGDITTSAFITPPSLEILSQRLFSRLTDERQVIQKRLEVAKHEILAIKEYDFLIINDTISQATEQFIKVANVARLKQSDRQKDSFLRQWFAQS
ncbi:MAG TPA: guanylate kinase [Epsilonproteobacteria bacterium]|nr:guanylate kinase [Campylobacterota bacterium]